LSSPFSKLDVYGPFDPVDKYEFSVHGVDADDPRLLILQGLI
jgi:hypothetical protein